MGFGDGVTFECDDLGKRESVMIDFGNEMAKGEVRKEGREKEQVSNKSITFCGSFSTVSQAVARMAFSSGLQAPQRRPRRNKQSIEKCLIKNRLCYQK